MQLLICVLNKTSVLETILRTFSENNINGATVLTSKGMNLYNDFNTDRQVIFAHMSRYQYT